MKHVVVIGGGLGGLSAAVTLRQQGFDVSLYEANQHLGESSTASNRKVSALI